MVASHSRCSAVTPIAPCNWWAMVVTHWPESLVSHQRSRNCHVHSAGGRPYSVNVSDPTRRDRLRELLDAVVDADNTDVGDMARISYASEFHFSREVRR